MYKRLYSFLILCVVILIGAGVISTVYLIKKRQDIQSRATRNTEIERNLKTYEQLRADGEIKPIEEILEVSLRYNSRSDPVLSIINLQKKNGYPSTEPIEKAYTISLLDSAQKVLYSQDFVIPNDKVGPPPLSETRGLIEEEKNIILDQVDFVLTLPWYTSGRTITVTTSEGKQIISRSVDTIRKIENKPNFKSIRGDTVLDDTHANNMQDKKVLAEETIQGGGSGVVDIAILAASYTDMNAFHSDADAIVTHMLTYEPMKTRASQIMVYYIDNTTNLQCNRFDRLLYCNDLLAEQIVNSSGAPHDTIYVLVNDPVYGGSGGGVAYGYNGELKGPMFLHESLGHSFGGLMDEYWFGYDSSLDNKVHGLYDQDGNCYAGLPPASAWNTFVGVKDYYRTCGPNNWYRSSSSSIMSTLSSPFFNLISQKVLHKRIDFYAGQYTDTEIPTSNIIAPLAGSTVQRTITIQASAADNKGIGAVQLVIDGVVERTTYQAPYLFYWKTTRVNGGQHALQVKAYDGNGNVGSSATISVLVNNQPDTIAPIIEIYNPTAGKAITDSYLWIDTRTQEAVDLVKVEFFANNTVIGTNTDDDSGLYRSFLWNNFSPGQYTLTAKAYDWAGNVGTSAPITVTIVGSTPTPTPIPQNLSRVDINPGIIPQLTVGDSVNLSTIAYGDRGWPIWSGVTYEWGISSDNSIATLSKTSGTISTLKALRPGHGDLFVTARYKGDEVTKSLGVDVSAEGITPTPSVLAGDINHDNTVNIQDYVLLIEGWGENTSNLDINGNGKVDIFDYTVLIRDFGNNN